MSNVVAQFGTILLFSLFLVLVVPDLAVFVLPIPLVFLIAKIRKD